MVQLQIYRRVFSMKSAFVDCEPAFARLTVACCHQSGLTFILQEIANRYDHDFVLALFYSATSQLLQFVAALGLSFLPNCSS